MKVATAERMGNNNVMLLIFFFYTYLFSTWSIYRLLTHFPESIDEFVFKPVLWIVPVLLIVVVHERKSIIKSLGLDFTDPVHDVLFGIAVALFLYGVILVSLYIKFGFFIINPLALNASGIVLYLFISMATAIVEEITFRGFFLTRLSNALKNRRRANGITTLLFLLVHLPILAFTNAMTASQIINTMTLSGIISLVDGYLFYHRKGIVAPIAAHAVWNFVAVLIR